MIRLALSEAQQRELSELKRDGPSHEERRRASIILDTRWNLTEAQLAERNDCSVSCVETTLSRLRRGGVEALLSARRKPHSHKVDAAGKALIAEAIRQSPRSLCPDEAIYDRSLWTLALMAHYIAASTGVSVGPETVRRYLLELRWRNKSPKLSCTSPDPEYATKMAAIADLRRQAEQGEPDAPLVFHCDEAKLEAIPTLRRMYRPTGAHVPLAHEGAQERRYLHGAVCYPTGKWFCQALPRMDTGCVVQFLEALLDDFPGREVWVIMDSAPAHHSKGFAEFLQTHQRLHVQYQPTYAPWTNPVERIWQEMRRRVTHAHELPVFSELVAAAWRWCKRLADAPEACRQLASFPEPASAR